MSANSPPDPYFNNINFNPSFFKVVSKYLTEAIANTKYLKLIGGTLSGFLGIGRTARVELDVNGEVVINNGSSAAPANGIFGSAGTRLVLLEGSASATPYALGINTNVLWYGTSSTGTHRFYTGTDERMVINSSGRVGIGTTDPSYILDVYSDNTSTNVGFRIRANAARESSLYLERPGAIWTIFNKGNGFGDSANNLSFSSPLVANVIDMTPSGNVGIRISDPANIFQVGSGARLRIANDSDDYSVIGTNDTDGTTNTKIVLSGNTRSGNAGIIEYISTSTGSHQFKNSSSELMRITSGGNVGIGTNDPGTNRLYVNGKILTTNDLEINNAKGIIFNKTATSSWIIEFGDSPTSVADSMIFYHRETSPGSKASRWWFNGSQTNTSSEISDERIKKEINDIQTPLNKIMELKPKEYYLCDDKDYNKKFGIIAQDVEKVFPEFIHTSNDYIANIYSYAKYNDFIITLDKDISNAINIDDELKIVLDNDDKNNLEIILDDTPYNNRYKRRFVKVIEIIDNYSFKIDIDIGEENIFIYGKKVDNFKRLDYESLYCLNLAGTQELYKIVENLQEAIASASARISALEKI